MTCLPGCKLAPLTAAVSAVFVATPGLPPLTWRAVQQVVPPSVAGVSVGLGHWACSELNAPPPGSCKWVP